MKIQRLRTTLIDGWPPLAWLATCHQQDPVVHVMHGPGVEVADEWICEAAWDGPFDAGDFDRTEIVAGTGIRLRDGRVTFVSSGSTVDRIQMISGLGTVRVSNSLPALLESTNARLDPTYPGYYWDFRSIVDGIRSYDRSLATTSGDVRLVYYDNVSWDGWTMRVVDKPAHGADFRTFDAYRDFLSSTMSAVANNLSDATRAAPFRMLGTTSTGYDSPTVTVLAAEVGCKEVLSFDRARGRAREGDSGEDIANHLGLQAVLVPRDRWTTTPLAEIPFIAANSYGEEVHYEGARASLAGRVLFTGYHGDKVWAMDGNDDYGELLRGDPSGLALTEYRLQAGFLHCAVPFWSARRVPEVVAISRSSDMAPWNVKGDYNRPICRRIVEEAGIDRNAFGVSKRAASVVLHNEGFLTDASMERYVAWIKQHRHEWLKRRRVPPLTNSKFDRRVTEASLIIGARPLNRLRRFRAYTDLERRWAHTRQGPTYLRQYVFPWAVHEARARYRLGDGGLTGLSA